MLNLQHFHVAHMSCHPHIHTCRGNSSPDQHLRGRYCYSAACCHHRMGIFRGRRENVSAIIQLSNQRMDRRLDSLRIGVKRYLPSTIDVKILTYHHFAYQPFNPLIKPENLPYRRFNGDMGGFLFLICFHLYCYAVYRLSWHIPA